MKRKLTAFLALLACGTTLGLTACSCGGKKDTPNTATDLEIFYWNTGNGPEWLDKTIAAFEAKYPEVTVHKNYNSANETWAQELESGDMNTIDLYVSTAPTLLAYTDYLEPLDDVLQETDENNVKLISKMDNSLLQGVTGADGKVYATNWGGGVGGLVYNKTVFDQKGYTIPRTTTELADLAADMVDDGYTPFIFPGNADYWLYCYLPWAAQYGGIDEINEFWESKLNGKICKEAFLTKAREESLKALEKVAAPNGYTHRGSNSTNHTEAQTMFLNGEALMMPNGSWLENEMKTSAAKVEMSFMKTPVVSSLATKLSLTDAILREVVSYVDSGDYDKGVFVEGHGYNVAKVKAVAKTKAKLDEIAAARRIVYTEAPSNKCFIPASASAKDYAKKFIAFMNSEEGLAYYYDTLQTPTLVQPTTEIDTSKWSTFAKSNLTLSENAVYVYRNKSNVFFYNNGLEFFQENPQKFILSVSSDTKMTAAQFWTKCKKTYNDNWDTWYERSGLDG